MTTKELKEEITDLFDDVSFSHEHEDKLIGYAESCGRDVILLYLDINFFITKNPIEDINKFNNKSLYATGYEKSVVGYFKDSDNKYLLVHEKESILEEMSKEMEPDEALEFYEYNIVGAYIENGPIYATINWSNILINKE